MKLDSEISKLQGRTLVEQIDVLSERIDIETEHRCNDCRSLQGKIDVLVSGLQKLDDINKLMLHAFTALEKRVTYSENLNSDLCNEEDVEDE